MSAITAPATRTATFRVEGMTCTSCAARVKSALEELPEVASAEVEKATDTATVQLKVPVAEGYLDAAIGERYGLRPAEEERQAFTPGLVMDRADRRDRREPERAPFGEVGPELNDERGFIETYQPLLTIVGLIAVVTVLAQAPFIAGFDAMLWMRHFMAGFFIVFAGFKLLDVKGFSESYRMYDVVAERLPIWGTIYPFVELALGLAYLTNVAPFWTNVVTIVVLGVSAIGVIRSVLDERTIKCACLGTGFNLPMSTVTIIEDVGMVAMAAVMLLLR